MIDVQVEEDSPAQKGRLKRKDVIIEANGQRIRDSSDWEDLIYLARIGEVIELKLLWNDREVLTKLVPESLPAGRERRSQRDLGMAVANITRGLANQLGIYDRRGVVIISVVKGSPAHNAGLMVGDIIRRIGDRSVREVDDYEEIMRRVKGEINMLIERGGSLYYVAFGG